MVLQDIAGFSKQENCYKTVKRSTDVQESSVPWD